MAKKPRKITKKEIDQAFASDQFLIFFQPQYEFASGNVVGLEGYIRWDHPKSGLMGPNLFLHYMESSGRMEEVSQTVLARGAAAIQKLASQGIHWRMSINVSIGALLATEFVASIMRLLEKRIFAPGQLSLDISEAALSARFSDDWPVLVPVLEHLRAAGIGLALEGPGTRPFDLAILRPFPFTEIKIGGQAIINFAQSTIFTQQGLIPARIKFARDYNIQVTAIGAESLESVMTLRDLGFTHIQGNYVKEAAPLDEIAAWWRNDFAASRVELVDLLGTSENEVQRNEVNLDDFEIPVRDTDDKQGSWTLSAFVRARDSLAKLKKTSNSIQSVFTKTKP